jgi:hypothetical protein
MGAPVGGIFIGLDVDLGGLVTKFKDGEKRVASFGTNVERHLRRIDNSISSFGRNMVTGLFQGLGQELFRQLSPDRVIAAVVSMNRELAALGDTAKRVNLSTDRLQELKFGANLSGMNDAGFLAGVEKFSALLDESKRKETDLSRLFEANNLKLRDREGRVISINDALTKAAEMVRKAATEQDKIRIAEMLGLTREWVKFLEQGAAGFDDAARSARAAGVIIDSATIKKAQEFDREWSRVTANWTARFKSGAAEILPTINVLIEKAFDALDQLNTKAKAAAIDAKLAQGLPLTIEELAYAIQLARSKGSPVDPSWVEQLERMKTAAKAAAEANRGIIPPKPAAAGSMEKPTVVPEIPQKTAFEEAVDGAQKRIALMDAETSAAGLLSEARERLRVIAELSHAAEKANRDSGKQNIEVTKEQKERIDQVADAMLRSAEANRKAKETWTAIGEVSRSFTDNLTDAILKTKSWTEALEALRMAIARVVLEEMAMRPFRDFIRGGFGSLSSSMYFMPTLREGGLVGEASKGIRIPAFAEGGAIGGRGTGRSDSNLILASRGEYIVNADSTARYRGLLEAINANRLPAFVDGGIVPSAITSNMASNLKAGPPQNVEITVNKVPADMDVKATKSQGPGGGLKIEMELVRRVDQMNARMISSGRSSTNRALEQRYGLDPTRSIG